ncbi:hypothetical protein [Streptomyces platensis]|uniref:DHH family phosphoesterase n=1 Tax=Streptomyces platensis TaxID=58346 RepID=UPI002E271B50
MSGLVAHQVRLTAGKLPVGDSVVVADDAEWRLGARQAHSGTHVLHAALREILGPATLQSGSCNRPRLKARPPPPEPPNWLLQQNPPTVRPWSRAAPTKHAPWPWPSATTCDGSRRRVVATSAGVLVLALNRAGTTTGLNAFTLVKQLLDGRGGGSADIAQGGGIPRDRLDGVLADVPRLTGRS